MPVVNTKIIIDVYDSNTWLTGANSSHSISNGDSLYETSSLTDSSVYIVYFKKFVFSKVVILADQQYRDVDLLGTHNKDPPFIVNYLYI